MPGLLPVFTISFRCYSYKYLYSEADADALIDTFSLGTGDSMPWRGKIASYKKHIFFFFHSSSIELPGSIKKILKNQGPFKFPRETPKQGKRTCNIMRSQQGLEKVKGKIYRKQRHCVKSPHIKEIFAILFPNSFISNICFLLPIKRKRKTPPEGKRKVA